MTTLERVQQVVAENTGADNVANDSRWADLFTDSLEAASVIVDLEDAFSVDIDGIYGFATVGDLVQFIDKEKA